jgi:phosphatidylglycerophosphate synthase
LLDGMVAIEGGKSTATRALFSEIPDRLADPLFLVLLGYASGYRWLGWLAALLAVLTAYVRVLGALGQPQDFHGVLAKQRPMAVLTVVLLVQAIVDALRGSRVSLLAAPIM